MTHDYGAEAHAAAERALMTEEDRLADDLDTTFCGCWTCVVRVVLDAAWPSLYAAAHDPDVPAP